MTNNRNKNNRLVGLFLLGCLFFNYPLLSLFNLKLLLFGLPLFYLYIFFAWIVLILLIARASKQPRELKQSSD